MKKEITIPKHFNGYQFRGTVGEGSFSVVKLAFHEETKQYYACKIVSKSSLNQEAEQRIEMEVRICQQLHHPGIVQIVDLLKDDSYFYIFMEFCPNGELFQYIVDNQRLSEKESANFMYQIFDFLRYLHSLGIAHRDLKPENILLDSWNMLKLSDFGLSKYVGKNGLMDTPCGSPCYASPECLSGNSYDGMKSDIWSCGVILYAMLTGSLPWTKRNHNELFAQVKSGDYKVPTFLSEECQSLLKSLLTVDVDKRITLEEAMNHPFIVQTGNLSYEKISLKLVSLKKVDMLFDRDNPKDDNDIKVDPSLIRSSSFKQTKFAKTARLLNDTKKLPPIYKQKTDLTTKLSPLKPKTIATPKPRPTPKIANNKNFMKGIRALRHPIPNSLPRANFPLVSKASH